MGERRMPARYRMDETGQMRRTWNGKLPEEFNEKDMLLFAIDTDLLVNGRVSAETQNAVREAGYRYENGNLLPLETQRKEAAMENQKNTLDVSVKVYPLQEKGGNLLAFASATVGGCFAVNGIRVMDSEKGKFVAMTYAAPPRRKCARRSIPLSWGNTRKRWKNLPCAGRCKAQQKKPPRVRPRKHRDQRTKGRVKGSVRIPGGKRRK